MSYASSAFTFLRLLQPSWNGALCTVIFSIGVIAALVIPTFYEGSLIDVYFETAISNQSGVFSDYNRWGQAVETSDAAGNAAVFVVWALVGLAVYYVVLSLLGAATNTFHFVQLVEYFKADRKRLETEALIRLSIRLSAIAGLYIVYKLLISTILPYVLYFTHKALFVSPLQGTLYLVSACLLIMLTAHTLIVLVRIMLLRYRIFRSSDDVTYD